MDQKRPDNTLAIDVIGHFPHPVREKRLVFVFDQRTEELALILASSEDLPHYTSGACLTVNIVGYRTEGGHLYPVVARPQPSRLVSDPQKRSEALMVYAGALKQFEAKPQDKPPEPSAPLGLSTAPALRTPPPYVKLCEPPAPPVKHKRTGPTRPPRAPKPATQGFRGSRHH